MAKQSFIERVKDPTSREHAKLLKHVNNFAALSRKEMCQHYSDWDHHDDIFRSKRKVDQEDRVAESREQPKKLNIPLSFAQIMTFVAFNITTLTQNKRFYQFEPTGTEDNPLREPMELIIERDLRKNTWNAFLVQFFLDIARFSMGVAEVCYEEQYRYMRVETEREVETAFGETETETSSKLERIPVMVGNRVIPVSPYRWLPDTRLPLTRYQEGEFCGSEDMFAHSLLVANEYCFSTDKIPKYTEEEFKARKQTSRIVDMPLRMNPNQGSDEGGDGGGYVDGGMVAVTKMFVDITPKTFTKESDNCVPLGTEAFPIRYLVWIANDKTIVRFEEAYYLHCKYPYISAQYIPDQHQTVNEGLAEVCDQITNLITWKWNAHITSQKNSVDSKWLVDPAGVDIKSLESRSPYIFLKKSASQTGVDRYIKQFITQDVTSNVGPDTAQLKNLLEAITGYNGMMQGEFSSGRRDATQSREVARGASARGRTTLGSFWDTAFEPLGKQLIANNRQEMDWETFQRILGPTWTTTLVNPETGAPYTLEEIFVLFKADAITIATSEDFFVFDGANPSENAYLAQSLQEILITIMSNPEVAAVLGYGPEQIQFLFAQIYTLRGVTQAHMPKPTPQPMMAPPAAPGVPPNVVQGPTTVAV